MWIGERLQRLSGRDLEIREAREAKSRLEESSPGRLLRHRANRVGRHVAAITLMLAQIAANIWVVFLSPWWLALPVGWALIGYSYTYDAQARSSWLRWRDKQGHSHMMHHHPEIHTRSIGEMILLRALACAWYFGSIT